MTILFYDISLWINKYLVGSLGLSVPTGSIKQTVNIMGMEFRAPYDMQLGSGTFALKQTLNQLNIKHKHNANIPGDGHRHCLQHLCF